MNNIEKENISKIIDNILMKYKGKPNNKQIRIQLCRDLVNYFPNTLSKIKLDYNYDECIYDLYKYMSNSFTLKELLIEHRNKIINIII
jgi:hypothetical protein